MATKRNQIYNTSQGLKCGNWKCHNEATGMPAHFEDTTLPRIDVDARARFAAEAVRCGVHIGAEKRRIHGLRSEAYVPITDEVRALALAYHKEREEADERGKKEERLRNEQRAQERTHQEWKELAEEPDYTVQYIEDTRWSGTVTRKFAIFTSEVLEHSKEHDRPLVEYNPVADIEIKEDSDDTFVRPSYVRLRVSSSGSAKLTRAIVEALTKAAEMVDAINVRQRAEYDRQKAQS